MVYLVHLTGCADTVAVEAASTKARGTIVAFIAFPPSLVPPNRRSPFLSFLQRRLDFT
jgi:hypothetical protein